MPQDNNEFYAKLSTSQIELCKKHSITSFEEAIEIVELVIDHTNDLTDILYRDFEPVVAQFNDYLKKIPSEVRKYLGIPQQVGAPKP